MASYRCQVEAEIMQRAYQVLPIDNRSQPPFNHIINEMDDECGSYVESDESKPRVVFSNSPQQGSPVSNQGSIKVETEESRLVKFFMLLAGTERKRLRTETCRWVYKIRQSEDFPATRGQILVQGLDMCWFRCNQVMENFEDMCCEYTRFYQYISEDPQVKMKMEELLAAWKQIHKAVDQMTKLFRSLEDLEERGKHTPSQFA